LKYLGYIHKRAAEGGALERMRAKLNEAKGKIEELEARGQGPE